MNISPLHLDITYTHPDGTSAMMFAQLMVDGIDGSSADADALAVVDCFGGSFRVWVAASSAAALAGLLMEQSDSLPDSVIANGKADREVPMPPPMPEPEKQTSSSSSSSSSSGDCDSPPPPPSQPSDELLLMDRVLGQYLSWFVAAGRMQGGSGPVLHQYCLHPDAAGLKHRDVLGNYEARSQYVFDLEQTRSQLLKAPDSDVYRERLLGIEQGAARRRRELAAEAEKQRLAAEREAEVAEQLRRLAEQQQQIAKQQREAAVEAEKQRKQLAEEHRRELTATRLMMERLLQDEVGIPRVFLLVPPPNTISQFVAKLRRPARWLCSKYYLFFVCPVTGKVCATNDGKGYSVQLPQSWVQDYGPAIRFSLMCVMALNGVGKAVAGVPMVTRSLQASVLHAMETPSLQSFINEIDQATPSFSSTAAAASAVTANTSPAAAMGSCYRALREVVHDVDPHLQRTGCERMVVSNRGEDSAVEWVSEEGQHAFKELGKKALIPELQLQLQG